MKDQKKELAELEQKCEEYLAGWKRAQADYQNLFKEKSKEMDKARQLVTADFIFELLPVVDHFELALDHVPAPLKNESWLNGFNLIKKQFADFLQQAGVSRIDSLGAEFDPALHEAVGYEPSAKAEGVIIKELQAGYKYKDNILRHAKVVVSKGK